MEPKKIILCPNPDRDTGMKATKSAIAILRDMGFQTVVCSPFRDPKTDASEICLQAAAAGIEGRGSGHHPWRRRNDPASGQAGGAAQDPHAGINMGGTGLSGRAGGRLSERFARPEKLGFSH